MTANLISIEDAIEDLLSASAYLAERIKSADGHAAAMSAVVPRYLSQGNVDLAAELANTVEDPFTRDRLLTLVAEKCAEIDDDEYAIQLVEAIEEDGLRSEALERVALHKVNKGQLDKALEIADSMSHADYVFASAAVKLAADGQKEQAEEMLRRAEFPTAAVLALQEMAMSELACGNKDACVTLLERAKETAIEIEHNEERIRNLCEIGNHFVEAGRNDLAIGAYDAAREEAEKLGNIHRDPLIAASVMGFLHAGSADTADRTLDLVTDKTQMANCLLAFSKYYWERGERDEALDALDEAHEILRSQRDMETRDSKARFSLFGSIAAQYAGFDKAERATEIASRIDDPHRRVAALSQVATVLAIRNEDDHARHALNFIEDEADRSFALIAMSDARSNKGDQAAAAAFLDEAVHLADDIPQPTARSAAYGGIARRYLALDEKQKALDVLGRELRTVAGIRDESNRAVALASLSDLFSGGDLELPQDDRQMVGQILSRR